MKELNFLKSLTSTTSINLQMEDVSIRVEVNHPRLETTICQYFAPFLGVIKRNPIRVIGIQGEPIVNANKLLDVPRAHGLPKTAFYHIDQTLVIYKKRSGVVYYIHDGVFYAVGDLIRYPQQLCNLVSLAFAHKLKSHGWISIHASAVTKGDTGIAFAGPSGSAKSTLALAMLDLGYNFVSNDRISLNRSIDQVYMAGVPKWPRVNPGTLLTINRLRELISDEKLASYMNLSPAQLWELEDKHDVPVDRVYGQEKLILNTKLIMLYILSWRRSDGQLQIKVVPQHEVGYLLVNLIKTELSDPPNLAPPSPLVLSQLLSDVRVFHVTGSIDVFALAQNILQHEQEVTALQEESPSLTALQSSILHSLD